MAGNDILSAILHYKRNIDKISDPPERALKYEDRLLHCINKLYKLPVNVSHLQETGVGRTVNALRKIEGEKGLGDAAKALVAKWKTMVMLEDEAERKQREECSGPSEEDVNRIKLIREAEKSELRKTENDSIKTPESQFSDNGRSHEGYKQNRNEPSNDSKSKKRKHESDEEEKNLSKRVNSNDMELKKISRSSLETKDVKEKSKIHSSSSSNSKNSERTNHKSSSSLKSHGHTKDDRKKEKDRTVDKTALSSSKYSPENSVIRHHKSSHKNHEKHENKDKTKSKIYLENDGFDSQSGASFADALGPILVKKSPKKKTSQNSSMSSPAENCNDSSISTSKEKKKSIKDLLFSQPKLDPLEPELVTTLPTPTPYYKPHPSYIPTQEAVKRRVQAEEDALITIMSNKNTRTKVFSGVKGGLTYVPSLYECCCRILQQHVDALEYTGGIPFSLLKPVLEGATPSQLYRFEHFNPYIIEDTDDLWQFHVSKEFRSEKRQEFESWRDMYLRCIDEREEKYKAVTANIIQRTIENSVPVRKAKLAYIDSPKPPRNILKKQQHSIHDTVETVAVYLNTRGVQSCVIADDGTSRLIKNGTAKPDSSKLLGKNDPEAVRVSAPKQPTTREPAVLKMKPKIAPLMQKTLKSIKMSRFKR